MNRTATAIKVRDSIEGFMGIVSPHFSKPRCKFLQQMLFGILAAKDVKLSQISRRLEEPISLKKTEERLSRHLGTKELGEKLNEVVAEEAASRIKRDTLVIVDPTDFIKPYAEKMPYLAKVRDGSRGELGTGYSGCVAVACEPGARRMVPLQFKLWSSKAPDFISENHQVLSLMRTIATASDGRGVFVYDRGGDRREILDGLLEMDVKWIVRQVGNRNVRFGNGLFLMDHVASRTIRPFDSMKRRSTRNGCRYPQSIGHVR